MWPVTLLNLRGFKGLDKTLSLGEKNYSFLKGLGFKGMEISGLNCLEMRRAISLGLQVGWLLNTMFKIILLV